VFVILYFTPQKAMTRFFDAISRRIGLLNEWTGRAVAWLTAGLVALVCFDVVIRYLFSETQAWIMELEWHMFSLIFLLGAGYAFRHDRHVRVDLFYANFSPRDKALVNISGNILFLIPWCVLIIYSSFGYAVRSYRIGETSPDPGGLPALYLIKFSIVLGVFLLLLQAVSDLIANALILSGHKKPEEEGRDFHEQI
jgi:TRAP-type mannitol/chloroaromatic compound transport system permease small subunit